MKILIFLAPVFGFICNVYAEQEPFHCDIHKVGTYYADYSSHCTMFHACVLIPHFGVRDFLFHCPSGTQFDQEAQICNDWGDVDCEYNLVSHYNAFDIVFGQKNKSKMFIPLINPEVVKKRPSENRITLQKKIEFVNSNNLDNPQSNDDTDLFHGSHSSNFFQRRNDILSEGKSENSVKENKKARKHNNISNLNKISNNSAKFDSNLSQNNGATSTLSPIISSKSNYNSQLSRHSQNVHNSDINITKFAPNSSTASSNNRNQNYFLNTVTKTTPTTTREPRTSTSSYHFLSSSRTFFPNNNFSSEISTTEKLDNINSENKRNTLNLRKNSNQKKNNNIAYSARATSKYSPTFDIPTTYKPKIHFETTTFNSKSRLNKKVISSRTALSKNSARANIRNSVQNTPKLSEKNSILYTSLKPIETTSIKLVPQKFDQKEQKYVTSTDSVRYQKLTKLNKIQISTEAIVKSYSPIDRSQIRSLDENLKYKVIPTPIRLEEKKSRKSESYNLNLNTTESDLNNFKAINVKEFTKPVFSTESSFINGGSQKLQQIRNNNDFDNNNNRQALSTNSIIFNSDRQNLENKISTTEKIVKLHSSSPRPFDTTSPTESFFNRNSIHKEYSLSPSLSVNKIPATEKINTLLKIQKKSNDSDYDYAYYDSFSESSDYDEYNVEKDFKRTTTKKVYSI